MWLHPKTQPLATLPTHPMIKREKFYKRNNGLTAKKLIIGKMNTHNKNR